MKLLLFLLIITSPLTLAQPCYWTVDYHVGTEAKDLNIKECRLIRVTTDTLTIMSDSLESHVSLYLLFKLSRLRREEVHSSPILYGCGIGLLSGYVIPMAGASLRKDNPPDWSWFPSSQLYEMMAVGCVLGGSLGLIFTLNEATLKYDLSNLTIPQKSAILKNLIVGENNSGQ